MPSPFDSTTSPPAAERLARGVHRYLADLGYQSLAEVRLGNGRRADILGIDRKSHVVLVEIKTSVADFRTDAKWPDYVGFCDAFYFAVPSDFPRDILPAAHGVMVADAWHAEIVRPAAVARMNATRRRHLVLRFALTAAARLQGLADPRL